MSNIDLVSVYNTKQLATYNVGYKICFGVNEQPFVVPSKKVKTTSWQVQELEYIEIITCVRFMLEYFLFHTLISNNYTELYNRG